MPSTSWASISRSASAMEVAVRDSKYGESRNPVAISLAIAEGFSITSATGTLATSRESAYPNSRIRMPGMTMPSAMLLGSRRICRLSLTISARMRRALPERAP